MLSELKIRELLNKCDEGQEEAEFAIVFAGAIEVEVHKQYADLIRQMLGALEESSPCVTVAHEWKSSEWIAKRAHAITAARARLGKNR